MKYLFLLLFSACSAPRPIGFEDECKEFCTLFPGLTYANSSAEIPAIGVTYTYVYCTCIQEDAKGN